MCPTCGQEPGVKSKSSQGLEVRTSKPRDRWSWSSSNGPPTREAGLPLRSSRHRTASQSVQTAARLPAGRRPAARGPVDATSENTRERRTKGGGSSETRSVSPVPPTPEVCKGSPRRRGLPAPGSSCFPLIHPHPHPALLHPLPTPPPPSRRRRSQAPAPSSSAAPSSRPQQRKVAGAEPAGASEIASLRLTLRTSGYGGWVPPPPHRGSKIIRDGRGPGGPTVSFLPLPRRRL